MAKAQCVHIALVRREGVEPPQPKPLVYSQLPSPMSCLRMVGVFGWTRTTAHRFSAGRSTTELQRQVVKPILLTPRVYDIPLTGAIEGVLTYVGTRGRIRTYIGIVNSDQPYLSATLVSMWSVPRESNSAMPPYQDGPFYQTGRYRSWLRGRESNSTSRLMKPVWFPHQKTSQYGTPRWIRTSVSRFRALRPTARRWAYGC